MLQMFEPQQKIKDRAAIVLNIFVKIKKRTKPDECVVKQKQQKKLIGG